MLLSPKDSTWDNYQRFKWLILNGLSTLAIWVALLRGYLLELHSTCWIPGADGLKNYFTFAYQSKWGSGLWFNGMQYPFGEYLPYTDAQPLLTLILGTLSNLGLPVDDHYLLIMQGSIVVSFWIGSYLIFRIGKHYGLPILMAWFIAALTMAFSPGIWRLLGHFALAYACILPAIWYVLIKATEFEASKKYSLLLGVLLLFSGLLHPYWILIGVLFVLAHSFVLSIYNKKLATLPAFAAVIALACFMVTNKVFDPVTDRPQMPWGHGTYRTVIDNLFSQAGFIYEWIKGAYSKPPEFEGYAYAGPFIYIVLPAVVFHFIARRFGFGMPIKVPRSLQVSMISALILLSMAAGLHTDILDGKLLEWIPPLAQFRSIGRFAWIYCMVAPLFFGLILHHTINSVSNSRIRTLIWVIISSLCIIEANQWLVFNYHKIENAKGENVLYTNTQLLDGLAAAGFAPNDFQCTMTLPASVEGAEKFSMHDNWHLRWYNFPFLFQTGLPSTHSVMSRSSTSQSLEILQLGSNPYITKSLVQRFPDDKPILTLIHQQDTAAWVDILQYSTWITSVDKLHLFKTPVDKLKVTKPYTLPSEILATFTQDTSGKVVLYNTFDNGYEKGLLNSALGLKDKKEHTLAEVQIDTVLGGDYYIISCWVNMNHERATSTLIELTTTDIDDQVIYRDVKSITQHKRIDIIDGWVRFYVGISPPQQSEKLVVKLHTDFAIVDELLITYKSEFEPVIYTEGAKYTRYGHQWREIPVAIRYK